MNLTVKYRICAYEGQTDLSSGMAKAFRDLCRGDITVIIMSLVIILSHTTYIEDFGMNMVLLKNKKNDGGTESQNGNEILSTHTFIWRR